eukprot:5337353-Amphidinium_carterae.1
MRHSSGAPRVMTAMFACRGPGVFHYNVPGQRLRRDLGEHSSVAVEVDEELPCGGSVFTIDRVLQRSDGRDAYGPHGVVAAASSQGRCANQQNKQSAKWSRSWF